MAETPKDFHINISSGTILRFFLILIGLAALYYLSDVLLIVVAAVIIASAVEPAVRRLKRYGIHRIVGAIIVYVTLAASLITILVFFMPVVINDVTAFLAAAPKSISLGELWAPIRDFGTGAGSLAAHTISVQDFVNGLRSFFGGGTGVGVFQTASLVFGGFLSFVLIAVLSFYLSVKEEGVDDFLSLVTPGIVTTDFLVVFESL